MAQLALRLWTARQAQSDPKLPVFRIYPQLTVLLGKSLLQRNTTCGRYGIHDLLLYLPRFKYAANLTLAETLAGMGMPMAFSESEADFSGMIETPLAT